MQYELILVFEHAHRNSQLDRNTPGRICALSFIPA